MNEAADDGTDDDALPENDGYDEADEDDGKEDDRDTDTLSLPVEGSCVLVVVSIEISTEIDVVVVVVVVVVVSMGTLNADDDAAGCAAHDRRVLSMPKMH